MKNKEKNKRNSFFKIILRSLLAVLAVIILVTAGVGIYFYLAIKYFDPLSMTLPRGNVPAVPPRDIIEYNGKFYRYNDDIVNILFIGMDNSISEIAAPNRLLISGGNADALILLSIDTVNRTTFLLNILRDTMTEIAIHDIQGNFLRNEISQIALAHHYGDGREFSARLTTQAVSNLLFDLNIFRHIRLNIDGLVAATDLFGGVRLTLPDETVIAGRRYSAGESITLNGRQANDYLRRRERTMTASTERSERHLHFIRAIFPQVGAAVKNDPFSIINTYSQLEQYVSTNMTIPELNYALQILTETGFDINNTLRVPGELIMGEILVEFIVDKDELYDIIINNYYISISEHEIDKILKEDDVI